MPNIIDCPACNRKLRVPESLAGTRVKCPTCGQTFSAPMEPAAPLAPPPAVVEPPPNTNQTPLPGAERPAEPPPLPSSAAPAGCKVCPYCGERIRLDANRCLFCSSDLTRPPSDQPAGNGPWMPGTRRDSEPHRGNLVLTLGILSFFPFLGLPLGIVAWVMGHGDLKQMRQGVMDPQGEELTQGGMVCGIIGTVCGLMLYGCCGFCMMMGVIAEGASAPPRPKTVRLAAPAELV